MKRLLLCFTSIMLFTMTVSAFMSSAHGAEKKSGACAAGCSGCSGCGINGGGNTISNTYYTDKKVELLKTYDGMEKVFRNVLADDFSNKEADEITQETKQEFKTLIPGIPYVGGDDNPMTEDIEKAAMVLAFYRVGEHYGMTADDVGNTVYSAIEQEYRKYPKWLLRLGSRKYFTDFYFKELKDQAALSQERRYGGDWVIEYVPEAENTYDYGYNITECAIVKYYDQQDAAELVSYLCRLDYLYSDYMDEGLVRTSTLAEGGKYCDFRYKRVENTRLDILTWAVISVLSLGVLLLISILVRYLIRKKIRS